MFYKDNKRISSPGTSVFTKYILWGVFCGFSCSDDLLQNKVMSTLRMVLISEMKWNGFSEKNSQKIRRQNYLYYCSTAQLIQHNNTAKPTAVTVGSSCTAYTVITVFVSTVHPHTNERNKPLLVVHRSSSFMFGRTNVRSSEL